MTRRDFITLLGGAAATWPPAARAQQTAMPVIGFLSTLSPQANAARLRAFRRALSELGFVEGRNLAIEFRFVEGEYDRLPAMAEELVRHPVAVLVAVAASLPHWPRGPRRLPFQSSSPWGAIRSRPAWSRATIGRVATSPE